MRDGSLPVSTAGGPVSPTSTTAAASTQLRKHAASMSTSLTDVAASLGSSGGGGSGSHEPAAGRHRKAAATSRLAVPRAPGRPPRTSRPASDGGATTAPSSRLPTAATGSVRAVGDDAVNTTVKQLTSLHPGIPTQQQQLQQQSDKSNHQPAAAASPSSSAHLTEEAVLRQNTSLAVLTDTLSSVTPGDSFTAALVARNNTGCLPVSVDDAGCHNWLIHRQSLPDDQRSTVSDGHVICQSLAEGRELRTNTSDSTQSDCPSVANERTLLDAEKQYQNAAVDHEGIQCIEKTRLEVSPNEHGMCQTVPVWWEDYPNTSTEKRNSKAVSERDEHQQNFLVERGAAKNVSNGRGSVEHDRLQSVNDDNPQTVIREDGQPSARVSSTYRAVGRTTSTSDNDETSCNGSETDHITLPPPSTAAASSVAMTTGATGSHSTTIYGE